MHGLSASEPDEGVEDPRKRVVVKNMEKKDGVEGLREYIHDNYLDHFYMNRLDRLNTELKDFFNKKHKEWANRSRR